MVIYFIAADIVILLTIIIIAFLCRNRYKKMQSRLKKDDCMLAGACWIGLACRDIIPFHKLLRKVSPKAATAWDAYLRRRVVNAHGVERAQFFFEIESANCYTYCILIQLVFSFIAVVTWMNTVEYESIMVFVLGLFFSACMFVYVPMQLKEKAEKNLASIKIEFPVFINKVMLLVNAGSTVSNAWNKATNDNINSTNPLYRELRYVQKRILSGIPESEALEEFARNTGAREIVRTISVITVNLKNGGGEVVSALRGELKDCFEMRKRISMRLGETASAKLMIPLMMSMVVLLMILGAPAIIGMTESF